MSINGWDPNNINTAVTLSNDDRTATANTSSIYATAISEIYKNSGKWYWELHIDDQGDAQGVGIAQADNGFTANMRVGFDDYSWAWLANGRNYHNADYVSMVGFSTNDRLMFALDLDVGKLWYGKNGTWNGGSDPATGNGANRVDGTMVGYNMYVVVSNRYANDAVTTNFKAYSQLYDIPSGFQTLLPSFKISGTLSSTARIIVLDETSWMVEANTQNPAGNYIIELGNTNFKTILAIGEDGSSESYTGVVPVDQ